MCFNDADDELWRVDPHEYVRKGYGKLRIVLDSLELALGAFIPGMFFEDSIVYSE